MGTPGFAALILDALLTWPQGRVLAAYTQPDRPKGRGRKETASDVKKLASARGIPVLQPVSFKDPKDVAELAALEPDVICVAAYGLILPQQVLDIPKLCCVNVHASLLPQLRGAAPIQRAILAGNKATGITIMRMDKGLDTGDIMLQTALAIGIDDTASTLHDELADLGGRMLVRALGQLHDGSATFQPQNHERATYAAKLSKDEAPIDWNRPALDVHNHIRAMHPWPGATTNLRLPDQSEPLIVTILPGTIGPHLSEPTEPGAVLGFDETHLRIACADREYLISNLCPQCRKTQDAASFYNGYLHSCGCKGLRLSC